jgi:glycosyltransferase involved in cell wall biosynthesis
MNICFYTDTFLPNVGGAEVVLDNLARQLARRGESIMVYAPGRADHHDYGYPVVRYRKPFSKRFAVRQALPKLMALHALNRFDVIHCHAAYPPAYVAATLRRWTGTPVVVRPHGSDILPGERIRRHPRLERRVRQTLQNVDAVVAQGEFLRSVVRELGVEDERLLVIHNGVDLAAFQRWAPFDHGRPYILALGTFSHRKGFDVLLRAFARLVEPRVDLLIAGSGPEEPALRELTQQLGLSERVRFTGVVSGQTKVNLYRSAEFFVCPSRREPFANVILEAMASGQPVVASSIGGNTELVRDMRNGLLFPSENELALAAALERLIRHPELAAKLGRAAEEFAKSFDWPVVAEKYLDLYHEVVRIRRQAEAA